MTDPFLITTAGLYLGLFWGLVAACLVLGWSLYGIWCGIAMRRRDAEIWYAMLETVDRACVYDLPQVSDTTQYLLHIFTGEGESIDQWKAMMRRRYEQDYTT